MIIKTQKERDTIKEAGKRLHKILRDIASRAKVGTDASELNTLCIEMIKEGGDAPAFLNYTPYGAKRPYPAALCVSINDEVVHGIPNETQKIFKKGDVVSFDCGLIHNGFFVDSAITIVIGEDADKNLKRLLQTGREALERGIVAAKTGNTTGHIGHAVYERVSKENYSVPKELGGHGVGRAVHEEPFIPNKGIKGSGEVLKEGQVIAIEPMGIESPDNKIKVDKDGYTYRTKNGARAVHFEHTIEVTNKGGVVIT